MPLTSWIPALQACLWQAAGMTKQRIVTVSNDYKFFKIGQKNKKQEFFP